jgi:hypothetical protein
MENLEKMTLAELNAAFTQLDFDLNYNGMSLREFRAKTRAMNQEFYRRIALARGYGKAALEPGFAPPQ